ncbi:hypothetical protein [Aridibaculum aurantiacum]|uniref:hypothetical protein n=1 Tax=Aridibaculum aurantiacum TaxID=2810307 RepID=UPI001A979761|nr:hypothetical protein [Aridibaculum aurantiacum]
METTKPGFQNISGFFEEKEIQPMQSDNEQVISYQKLRTFIGIIGVCLPIALVLGCYIFGAGENSWQHSISHYYYSKMHFVFLCTLCVLGGFLITYKGKRDDPWESRLANIAGYCSFGVAAFPTQFEGFRPAENGSNQYLKVLQEISGLWGGIHFAFAGGLFVCFIIFCLHFFQKPDEAYTAEEAAMFNRRRWLYKICGWGIAVSIACIALFSFIIKYEEGLFAFTTFIFETTALWFFGTAWLVKGSKMWRKTPVLKQVFSPLRQFN